MAKNCKKKTHCIVIQEEIKTTTRMPLLKQKQFTSSTYRSNQERITEAAIPMQIPTAPRISVQIAMDENEITPGTMSIKTLKINKNLKIASQKLKQTKKVHRNYFCHNNQEKPKKNMNESNNNNNNRSDCEPRSSQSIEKADDDGKKAKKEYKMENLRNNNSNNSYNIANINNYMASCGCSKSLNAATTITTAIPTTSSNFFATAISTNISAAATSATTIVNTNSINTTTATSAATVPDSFATNSIIKFISSTQLATTQPTATIQTSPASTTMAISSLSASSLLPLSSCTSSASHHGCSTSVETAAAAAAAFRLPPIAISPINFICNCTSIVKVYATSTISFILAVVLLIFSSWYSWLFYSSASSSSSSSSASSTSISSGLLSSYLFASSSSRSTRRKTGNRSSSSSKNLCSSTVKWSFLWWHFISILAPCLSLSMTEVRIPKHIMRFEDATLGCKYDLDGESLYSVKWYKDGFEFYRYVPRDMPPGQVFPLPGVDVELENSTDSVVVLRRVTLQSTGRYRCEVSGEAPSFQTVSGHEDMIVVVTPTKGPQITGGQPRYQINEVVRVNCTSAPSKPICHLSWLINGMHANRSFLRYYDPRIVGREGLEMATLGLEFRVRG